MHIWQLKMQELPRPQGRAWTLYFTNPNLLHYAGKISEKISEAPLDQILDPPVEGNGCWLHLHLTHLSFFHNWDQPYSRGERGSMHIRFSKITDLLWHWPFLCKFKALHIKYLMVTSSTNISVFTFRFLDYGESWSLFDDARNIPSNVLSQVTKMGWIYFRRMSFIPNVDQLFRKCDRGSLHEGLC